VVLDKYAKISLCGGQRRVYSVYRMQPTNDQSTTDQTTDRRVTVAEAALLLGLSEDAVRSRLKRGTLRRERGADGTVLVILGPDGSPDRPPTKDDQLTTRQPTDQAALTLMQAHLDSLQKQVDHLQEQLAESHEANRENRRIIAGLVQRVPELEPAREASPGPRESSASTSNDRENPHVAPEEGRQSWWRRFFGFEA
jgi:hypothetical protein